MALLLTRLRGRSARVGRNARVLAMHSDHFRFEVLRDATFASCLGQSLESPSGDPMPSFAANALFSTLARNGMHVLQTTPTQTQSNATALQLSCLLCQRPINIPTIPFALVAPLASGGLSPLVSGNLSPLSSGNLSQASGGVRPQASGGPTQASGGPPQASNDSTIQASGGVTPPVVWERSGVRATMAVHESFQLSHAFYCFFARHNTLLGDCDAFLSYTSSGGVSFISSAFPFYIYISMLIQWNLLPYDLQAI